MSKRSAGTLILGLLLIAAGVLFLTINLAVFNVGWVIALKIIFPALFIYIGLSKLIRHFAWDKEKLEQNPGNIELLEKIEKIKKAEMNLNTA